MKPRLTAIFVFCLCACASVAPATKGASDSAAERLYSLLKGTFDSSAQAAANAEDYKPIQLAICAVDAPTLGPRVLYVEQAMQTALDKPYRQRLYVVEPGADNVTAVSRVLELKSPQSFVGLCGRGATGGFAAADAEEKRGCAVTLKWNGAEFAGATQGTACPSALRGASYATSEVTLNQRSLTSWDRGYDAGGTQVWGAEKGAYIFVRK
jgi:CpeT protein